MKHCIFILLLFQLTTAFGQVSKKAEKAINTFNNGKEEKGISQMEKVISKDPSEVNWEVLVKMYHKKYLQSKTGLAELLLKALGEGELKDKDGNTINIVINSPSSESYDELIAKCRESGLYARSQTASMLLRSFLVDYKPDTAVSEEAVKEFKIAEKHFGKKEYATAKEHYQAALILQPDYYKSTIYLGDSYWFLEDMDSAIFYFHKGIEMHPTLLEPRKFLVDALNYSKDYKKAKEECINAICLYPDESMYLKYANLIRKDDRVFNRYWTTRQCEVNAIGKDEATTENSLWANYQKAESEINSFCDSTGIITEPNSLTKAKYLEVYSWEKMLNSTTSLPPELAFAKEMQNKGFLDCYVFLSVFHHDTYGQYADFVANNKERIQVYLNSHVIE